MGIAFISAKKEQFDHESDAAFEEQFSSENLFSALPDQVEVTYRCESITDDLPQLGDGVLLYKTRDSIKVIVRNRHVANVMMPDAQDVEAIMDKTGVTALPGRVSDVRVLTNIFSVYILPPKRTV